MLHGVAVMVVVGCQAVVCNTMLVHGTAVAYHSTDKLRTMLDLPIEAAM